MLKRPLFLLSMSFVAGMYILSFVSFESLFGISICITLALLFVLIKKKNVKSILLLFLCIVMFCSGAARYEFSNNIKRKALYNYNEKTVLIEGEIIEEPVLTEKTVSFIGRINTVDENGEIIYCDEKVRFSHFINKSDEKLNIPSLGNNFKLIGEISIPDSAMNTGGFDYSRYLKGDNIFFQCEFVLDDLEVTSQTNESIPYKWEKFRQKCISFFDESFPCEEGTILKAFLVGDKSSLGDETKETFSSSGLSHILAVSGLHVSFFAVAIGELLAFFSRSKRKQMTASAVASIFFVLFTGASISAIRAGVMCVMALLAKLIYRKADSITVLAGIAAVFAAINPHVVYDASFMLSFSATAGIIILTDSISLIFKPIYDKLNMEKKLHREIFKTINGISVSIAAQIFVIPVLVYLFNGFSTMSVITTVIVTPFLKPLLIGGILFCALSFVDKIVAIPVAVFIYLVSKIIIFVADIFGSFSFSKIIIGALSPSLLLIYAVFVAVLVFAIRKKKTHFITSLACLTFVLAMYFTNYIISYNTAQVSFINVGNGDCALLKAPGDCDILIDAGGSANSTTSGKYIIAPYLMKNGVNDIEYVILSHTHADHVNGLIGLFDIMEIKHIIMPYNAENTEEAEKIRQKADEYDIPITYFVSRDALKISDNIKITAITPDAKQSLISKDANDSCLTLRIDYGKTSFLFTGDITSDIEGYILDHYSDLIDVDVLKVAHHGSDKSTTQEFVDAVKPKYSYIPVGKNSYGHPSDVVIERLRRSGSRVYTANIHRDVTFYFDDKEITHVKYKAIE